MHVCSPQRCWCFTRTCDIYKRSRHIHTFGRCGWKCRHQEALQTEPCEPGSVFDEGSHGASARSSRGTGGSIHSLGLLPWGSAANSQLGPHRARIQPELRFLRSAAMEHSWPTGRPHQLLWIWRHQCLTVSRQHLMSSLLSLPLDRDSQTKCVSVELISVTSVHRNFFWTDFNVKAIRNFNEKL